MNFREFASNFCLYRKSCWQKIIQILHTKQYVNWQRIEMNRRIKMSRWFADYEDFGKSWFLLRFFDTVKYLDFCKVWLNVWGDPHHLLFCVFLVCCNDKTSILAKNEGKDGIELNNDKLFQSLSMRSTMIQSGMWYQGLFIYAS